MTTMPLTPTRPRDLAAPLTATRFLGHLVAALVGVALLGKHVEH